MPREKTDINADPGRIAGSYWQLKHNGLPLLRGQLQEKPTRKTEGRNVKAILEYDLPSEQSDFYQAINGIRSAIAICEIVSDLRSKIKYGHDFENGDEALDWALSMVYEKTKDLPELE